MAAPLTPHWTQPSHPAIQAVHHPTNPEEFTTKSLSRISLPPYGLFAKMDFPPCTEAEGGATYATVQMGRGRHLNLNSDLVYVNHSCVPSLIFDTSSLSILAGPSGLQIGQELTFFYPSTEWDMAQPFHCFCGAGTCRGVIDGAGNMPPGSLDGVWLNAHIREMLEERDGLALALASGNGEKVGMNGNGNGNGEMKGNGNGGRDVTEEALKASLEQAKKMVESAQRALDVYKSLHGENGGAGRRGVSSREMSGEMGGDTIGNGVGAARV